MLGRLGLALGVFALTVASAAGSYTVKLYQAATLNGAEFKAGECKLELKGDKVVLKQGKTLAEAVVKVESAPQKFSDTSVDTSDGKIHEIRLGGTTTKLVFQSEGESK